MTSLSLPRPFGPYTLLRRLAAGGMAEVYLASARGVAGFEKPVAIKRIHPSQSALSGSDSTLVDEAKLSVALSHQNIVQTFDLGCVEGTYFIVMEHVEGYDAQHLLDALHAEGRSLSVDLAAHIMAEVCRGLDYAHRFRDERGSPRHIVHRDVSPQNVLLSFAGEVKLADFGIARSEDRRSDPEARVIKGKYFYMSPEQAGAEPLDHRSDIFSAGIVLWELLIGRRLQQADDLQSLLDAVRHPETPAPSSLRPDVPRELDAIVARATAVDPVDRYAGAAEMADALNAYLSSRPAVHAAQRIGRMLVELPPPLRGSTSLPEDLLPQTRDRVVTQPLPEPVTPAESPLRYDLEAGRPTVAGWRSPQPEKVPHTWLWALSVGSALVGLVAWLLYGF